MSRSSIAGPPADDVNPDAFQTKTGSPGALFPGAQFHPLQTNDRFAGGTSEESVAREEDATVENRGGASRGSFDGNRIA